MQVTSTFAITLLSELEYTFFFLLYLIYILCFYFLFRHCIAIHLDKLIDKFHLLVFMTKKLFAFVNNKCAVEGVDSVMMQECLMGGHLYLQVIKEKLMSWLTSLKISILKRAKSAGNRYTLTVRKYPLQITSSCKNKLDTIFLILL